ncbi:MAG TPA: hypothetical protein VFJ43_07900 [Bacteroidia bacterium]|nr:hypothetical protein [Bacteroidia bacterium]
MSYNSFLDTYFSSKWFGYGIPLLVMIILIVFAKKIYRQKEYTFWMRTVNIAIPFALAMISALINPMYWGYGKPIAVDKISFMNGKLFVEDYIASYGSRYASGDAYSRIHVFDPETGTKKIRFLVGNAADLIGMHGDSLCVTRYDDAAYFSADNGHLFTVYNKETLPKLFPELSSGVNNFMWGDERSMMEISAQNGTNWNLYLKSGRIYSSDKKSMANSQSPYVPTYKLSINEREIRIDDQPGEGVLLKLDGLNENQHKLYIMNDHDSILNEDLFFLDGRPVVLDLKDSSFFILHYETLKKEKFLITCMSLDGKRKLWEIKQSDFNPDFNYSEPFLPKVGADEKSGKLFFSIDKEIFAVNMKDGKLLWRTKL